MWIRAGTRYFNTDTIAYIQVTVDENSRGPRAVYLHFINENHTFTLHGEEAANLTATLESVAINANPPQAVVGSQVTPAEV